MPRTEWTGAYGVPAPVPPAIRAHPERASAFAQWLTLAWILRLSIAGGLFVALLYGTHVI